jgi:hypothetical protein
MTISESSVDKNSILEVTTLSAEVLPTLTLPHADTLLEAIDLAVYDWQQSGKPTQSTDPEIDDDDLIYAFGTTWGNAIIERHGWHWADLTFHAFDDWEGRAVVAPDSSLIILPYAHIYEAIAGDEEVKMSASFNAIGSNVIPTLPANEYVDLINNIQRIIPR